MINFLDPVLNPKVVCDRSAMDGYEAQNLISKNYLEKSSGFLAYSTVKPPIELDFEFICPVNIFYIVIKSSVGSHNSTGVELFAKNLNSFMPIGKSLHEEDGVVFLSSQFYSKDKLPPTLPQNYNICYFRRTGNVLHNTKKIKVKIIRSGKYVPCLGSVEVWGDVSRNCSELIKRNVKKIYEKKYENSSNILSSLILDQSSNKDLECVKNEEGIPDDFKDDLTYELMTIPMTLPSGKTVDQRTLEKHIASEQQYGRKPGDPFTGLKFTNISKPILNVSLKCRIDMFMLKNSSRPEFFNVARIVGRKQNVQSEDNHENEVKKLKLEDGDEIIIDTAKLKLNQFKRTEVHCCIACKSTVVLFTLPCKHIYCRKCLNEICASLKCKSCSENFIRSNVERYHV